MAQDTSTSMTVEREAQLRQAITRRQRGDAAGALQIAEACCDDSDDAGPFLTIAGLAALELGDPARAAVHFAQLLKLRPDDIDARGDLARALLETGREDEALALAHGSAFPPLARIEGWIRQQRGQDLSAINAYARALKAEPADPASWNNLGNIYAKTGDTERAIGALEMAITYAPNNAEIYLNLCNVLRQADRGVPRLKVARDAAEVAPDSLAVQTELAMAHAHVEELDDAIRVLEAAVLRWPAFGEHHLELGRLYEATSRTAALAGLLRSLDLAACPPEAAFLQAWLAMREGRFEDAAAFAAAVPETIHPMRREALIGSIAERLGNTDQAFGAFERMNVAALADSPPSNGPNYREKLAARVAGWTPEWAARWTPALPADPQRRDPIFLVGFPRSGTTLLDTMLMGLPELSVLEERPMLAETMKELAEADLSALDQPGLLKLRENYFTSAVRHGWSQDRWLVDKHPLNMARVPEIHRLFPQARFILAERHPADVVLSCFMANFQLNQAMRSFTDLEEAARTYDAVFTAWSTASELFAIDSKAVRYERLVEDPRGQLEPLVAWLGLVWDDQLLAHEEIAATRTRVRTASYAQIGEKLYTRAAGRWRRYADHLAPVMPILDPWIRRLGYDA